MALLGAILGILVGFGVGVIFTEWVFVNNQSWPDVVPIALAALGGLAGAQLGRRFAARRVNASPSA
jgi:hypothetical protein